MKKLIFVTPLIVILIASCSKNDKKTPDEQDLNYRDEMRSFVIGISQYSKTIDPGFYIIPQNGQDLVTMNGTGNDSIANDYVNAIDGQGKEDLFYGYDGDDIPTPAETRNNIMSYLDRIKPMGKTILVTDYCFTQSKMTDSYVQNYSKGYVSFAADHRELNNIPAYPPVLYNQNQDNISTLNGVKNFLYLIDPGNFNKSDLINAIRNTNYDLILIDLFVEDVELTASEIDQLKQKKDGGKRLVICYMSIGEAEDYRYYWQNAWYTDKPSWLDTENPDWPGNYKVKYWIKDWQNIIYGNDQSYCKKILNAHFDGVYLDLIDAYEYYEK